MKKLLLATLIATAVAGTTQAQNDNPPTFSKASASKTDKDAAKAKKEADLVDAFTKAELSADQQAQCRAILTASNDQTKPVKADAALTEEAKKEKLEAIYKERNDKLKAVMGDAKYKVFKATQKAQKEAAAAKSADQ